MVVRFASKNGPLQKRVIVRKYGEEEGGWVSRENRVILGLGLWQAIKKG